MSKDKAASILLIASILSKLFHIFDSMLSSQNR